MKRLILLLFILSAIIIATDLYAQTDAINPEIGGRVAFGVTAGEGYHTQYAWMAQVDIPQLTEWLGLNKYNYDSTAVSGIFERTYTFSIVPEIYILKSKFSFFDSQEDIVASYTGISLNKTIGVSSFYFSLKGGIWNMIDAVQADDQTKPGFGLGLGAEPFGVQLKLSAHDIYIADKPDYYTVVFEVGINGLQL